MDGAQPTTSQVASAKKAPLEGLSKEELIKKCRGLLVLAQKAKQSKDEFAEENKVLKEALNNFETQKDADKKSLLAMKEMVDALTNDKLSHTIQITDMQMKLSKYQKEVDKLTAKCKGMEELSIENESLKRQIQRLGDENEELLNNLDSMEKKLEQVNQFGMQQQKDLILLEEATAKWKSLEMEWKEKLDEVKEENQKLQQIIEIEKSKQIVLNDNMDKTDIVSKSEAKLKLTEEENETLRREIENSSKDYNNLLQKCKHFEEMCANHLGELDDLRKTSEITSNNESKMQLIQQENETLRKSIEDCSKEYDDLIKKYNGYEEMCIKRTEEAAETISELEEKLKSLQEQNEALQETIENSAKDYDNLMTQFKSYEEKSAKQINDLACFQSTIELQKEKLAELGKENTELKQIIEADTSKQIISNLEVEKSNIISKLEADVKLIQKENENLQQNNHKFSNDYDVLLKKCKSYEEMNAKQAVELDGFRKTSEIQSARLQNIKIKLTEVTMKLKKLKKSKTILADAVQEYYQAIPKWQQEVQKASEKLCVYISTLDKANKNLEFEVIVLKQQLQSLQQSNVFYKTRLESLSDCCNKVISEESKKSCKTVDMADAFTVTEQEYEDDESQQLKELFKKSSEEFETIKMSRDSLQNQLQLVKNDKMFYEQKLLELIECCNEVLSEKENKKINLKLQDLQESLLKAKEDYQSSQKHLSAMQEDFNKQSIMLENARKELEALHCEKTERIRIESDVEELQLKLGATEKDLMDSIEQNKLLRSTLVLKETEHADLLSEMRELNEALKGRGDVISRQQDKIAELEKDLKLVNEKLLKLEVNITEKDDVIAQQTTEITKMSKEINDAKDEVNTLSNQARESEQIIKNLSDEMNTIRDRITDMQSDALSTSTISRAEETSRMREVDESFEEKYNKLRSLAIKLKKKVQEQTNQIAILENDKRKNSEEKNDIRAKLGSINIQVKNLQALQNENDKLLDEIEKMKKEKSNAEKQIKDLADKIQALSDVGISSKHKTENVIQEYQNQIKVLKQEKESFNLIKKEWEKERDNLKGEVVSKDKQIGSLRQEIEKNKIELERCKTAGKQSSVLNLEIEAYEKSLNDATQNLKTKEALIKDLHESIKNKDESLELIKKEVKLLEESLESERIHSSELKQQMDLQQAKFKENEHEKSKLRERVQDLTTESEMLKSQVDELRLQLSELVSEKEKLIKTFQKEKENLYRQVVSLEENLTNLTAKLKTTECEVEDLKTEYANYKLRAQSILRQNQTKETSRERELEEEITAMRSTVETLNLEITTIKEATAVSERKVEEFRQDNERIQKRCKDLMQLLEESRLQNEAILEDNRKQSQDYQESLKAHRLQIDAINTCYKKQVEEMEIKHSAELEELKKAGSNDAKENRLVSRVAPFGGPKTSDEQKIDLILMEREDAEGSEMSVPIPKRRVSSIRSKHDVIPLDELLNSSFEDQVRVSERSESPTFELQTARENLQIQESRIKHLTSLLSETEQDLARLTQLNEVLKEEVRRHERAVEREQHIQNSEYLKNVVLKFLTLASGDERSRLVPVLNTILKLSPEETQTLQNVAKGADIIQRGWGSYLPIWSNHQ